MLRVKRDKKKGKGGANGSGPERSQAEERERLKRLKELTRRRDQVTAQVETAEERVGAINETFCDPTYFERTPPKEVRKLELEQKELGQKVEALMGEWQAIEEDLEGWGGMTSERRGTAQRNDEFT